MTKQEIFNKVVAGLAAQGFERSVMDDGSCAYRGNDGRKCAAGHLLSDEHYRPELENKTIAAIGVAAVVVASGVPGHEATVWGLVGNLQRAHDRGKSPGDMKSRLLNVGYDYGLEIPEVLK